MKRVEGRGVKGEGGGILMSIISAASATELVSHPVIKVEFLSLIGGPPAWYN